MTKAKRPVREYGVVRRALIATLAMLMVASTFLVTSTYAWLTLAISPEITGITTNIAANGSLEIALLTTDTRQDLTTIKTTIGQSLAVNKTTANNTWGNLVDLTDASYGLGEIVLNPARLNLTKNADGTYSVDQAMLSVPTYGYDGRIVKLTNDTLSAVYGGKDFTTTVGTQDYGVRAIGTTSTLSVQGSALALAKANIVTYTNSAKSAALSALTLNFEDLFSMLMAHSTTPDGTYDDADLTVVKNMVNGLDSSLTYIDDAIRQGVLAVAASKIGDVVQFNAIRDLVSSGASYSELITKVENVPAEFTTWTEALATSRNNLNAAIIKCNALNDGEYTWDELKDALTTILNIDNIYIGKVGEEAKKFSEMTTSELAGMVGSDVEMTLVSGSGVFADVADFTDDYTASLSVVGMDVEISTLTQKDPAYLIALRTSTADLQAADGSTEGETKVTLEETYGYALDMAFRTNAMLSELLLQTDSVQRVYADATTANTLGGGSYMKFTTSDDTFTLKQMTELMDAVRVAFIDDKGTVLGIAKLNTSNRYSTDGVDLAAPLYLYDFEISTEEDTEGALIMGERQKEDNAIVEMTQGIAKAVTVLVWLDGDIVDNSMVAASAEDGLSLAGTLNVQFASSADLYPANDSSYKFLTADKSKLKTLVDATDEAYYQEGKGNADNKYTTVSWNEYVAAYAFAKSVCESDDATEAIVLKASTLLNEAEKGLTLLDIESVRAAIREYRTALGKTDEIARYVVRLADGTYASISAPTQAQIDGAIGTINRIDATKNLQDEGNDLMTPIYTDASWQNLAEALYDAESVANVFGNPSSEQLDNALTALKTAYDALERRIMYAPYEYQGLIYYFAITNPEDADTYGKWYDSNFKRIVADLTILKLDANAKSVSIAEIVADSHVPYNNDNPTTIAPYVQLLDDIYPDLSKDGIKAINWNVNEFFNLRPSLTQKNTLQSLITRANLLTGEYVVSATLIKDAQNIVNDLNGVTSLPEDYVLATSASAQSTIEALAAAIAAQEQAKAEADAAADPNMTANQRLVLTLAVNNAKAIEGYDDAEELTDLRTAVTAAEALLASADPQKADAAEKLNALNAQLTANGLSEVTEYNTIQHKLPGSEIADVVYVNDSAATFISPKGETGEGIIEAVVLTNNGVVATLYKTVNVYVPADDVVFVDNTVTVDKIVSDTALEAEQRITSVALNLDTDPSKAVYVLPTFNLAEADLVNEAGEPLALETIASCTWASDNLDVVSVEQEGKTGCTLIAKGAGVANISVSVETVQGRTFTGELIVTVTAPATTEP